MKVTERMVKQIAETVAVPSGRMRMRGTCSARNYPLYCLDTM